MALPVSLGSMFSLSNISALICVAIIGGAGLSASGQAQDLDLPQTPVVVELFTSPTCPTCPPANAHLTWLAQQDGILALSLPVDYMHIVATPGVRAAPNHARRQVSYNHALGRGMIYTPEMVIGGRKQMIGTYRTFVSDQIKSQQKTLTDDLVPVTVRDRGSVILFEIAASTRDVPLSTVWLVPFKSEQELLLQRKGKNIKSVTYTNVAQEHRRLGTWAGEEKTIRVEISPSEREDYSGFALLVQEAAVGPIRAAAKVMLN